MQVSQENEDFKPIVIKLQTKQEAELFQGYLSRTKEQDEDHFALVKEKYPNVYGEIDISSAVEIINKLYRTLGDFL